MSVSEDGSFLLVVERFVPPGQSYYRPASKVDTSTGAVTTFDRSGYLYVDVEILDSSTAILVGAQPQVQKFNLLDYSYSALPNGVYYSNYSVLVQDKNLTLLAEMGISSGPLRIHDDRTGTIVASGDNYQTIGAGSGQTGFNFGHQAISEKAGLVAQFIYSQTINPFDLNLRFVGAITLDAAWTDTVDANVERPVAAIFC